jgi:hypothetical protein
MINIMSSTHDWAQDAFKRELEETLDDPSDLRQEDVDFMEEVASDLRLDFIGLINELGTPYECQRFKEKFKL